MEEIAGIVSSAGQVPASRGAWTASLGHVLIEQHLVLGECHFRETRKNLLLLV